LLDIEQLKLQSVYNWDIAMENYKGEDWVSLYQSALIELEQAKMSGRIEAAHAAILARIRKTLHDARIASRGASSYRGCIEGSEPVESRRSAVRCGTGTPRGGQKFGESSRGWAYHSATAAGRRLRLIPTHCLYSYRRKIT
jgi:hypothetical protein